MNSVTDYDYRILITWQREREREIICEPITNLLSRAMGQVLLPHVRGDPYE